MSVYSFTLTLDRSVEDLDEIDVLYGLCKDVSLENAGPTTFVHFDREAKTLDDALRSALANVQSCGYGIKHIEVQPESILVL